MDHPTAHQMKASERYMLGEMTDLERDMFEDHYFTCPDCAEDVRIGAVFAKNASAVFADARQGEIKSKINKNSPPWLAWLRPASLVPMAASVALAILAGYQSFVTIPSLRVPAAVAPVVLAPASRGAENLPELRVGSSANVAVSLFLAVAPTGSSLTFEVRNGAGALVQRGVSPVPASGAPLVLFLATSGLSEAGTYRINLKEEATGTEAGEFRFAVQR